MHSAWFSPAAGTPSPELIKRESRGVREQAPHSEPRRNPREFITSKRPIASVLETRIQPDCSRKISSSSFNRINGLYQLGPALSPCTCQPAARSLHQDGHARTSWNEPVISNSVPLKCLFVILLPSARSGCRAAGETGRRGSTPAIEIHTLAPPLGRVGWGA